MRVVSEGYDGIMFYESIFLVTFALFWILIPFDFFGLHGLTLCDNTVTFQVFGDMNGMVRFILWVSGTGSHGTISRPNGPRLLGLRVGRLFIFVFCKYIWCLLSVRIKF